MTPEAFCVCAVLFVVEKRDILFKRESRRVDE